MFKVDVIQCIYNIEFGFSYSYERRKCNVTMCKIYLYHKGACPNAYSEN